MTSAATAGDRRSADWQLSGIAGARTPVLNPSIPRMHIRSWHGRGRSPYRSSGPADGLRAVGRNARAAKRKSPHFRELPPDQLRPIYPPILTQTFH